MPTPGQLAELRRQQQLAAHGDFEVHDVIECVSSGDEGHGEEDLAPHQQVLTLQEQLTRQRELRAAEDAERAAAASASRDAGRTADTDADADADADAGAGADEAMQEKGVELEDGHGARTNEGEGELNCVD